MAKNIDQIAAKLGATRVALVPDTGGGAFGAARLAEIVSRLQQRMSPGQGKRPGRPTVITWVTTPKVPMSDETEAKLARLASRASETGRRITPMQLAAQLLEEVVARLPEE